MKKYILIVLIIGILFSCNNTSHKNKKNGFVENPTTLEELFRGFSKDELTPDVYNLKKDSVVIVVTGHLYPLLRYPEVYKSFLETVRAQKPDYFFALGDVVYNNTEKEWNTVLSNFFSLNVPVYYSPGNHDLNYHYERYYGKHDHQIEAEMRYLRKAKCRYKLLKDNFANYVFINANDSIKRVLSFIRQIKPELDTNKHLIMLSSQSLWHNKKQDLNNPKTWVEKPFGREELLPKITYFQTLIHGDWAGTFYRGRYKKKNGFFDVMAVGNRKSGDKLYITRITINKDTIIAKPIFVPIPPNSKWFHKKK